MRLNLFLVIAGALSLYLASCVPQTSTPYPMTTSPLPEYTGPRETLAFINETKTGYGIINRELSDLFSSVTEELLLRNAYLRSRFVLVDRTRLEKVLREQRLSASGLVSPENAPELGKLIGAQYILFGSLVTADRSRQTIGVPIPGLGQNRASVIRASIGLSFTLVDSQTGRIVAKASVEKSAEVLEEVVVRGVGTSTNETEKVFGDLVRGAVTEGLFRISNQLSGGS